MISLIDERGILVINEHYTITELLTSFFVLCEFAIRSRVVPASV
jgi:hypothetical protein